MMTIDDVIYCVKCHGLEVEWFDCSLPGHDEGCFELRCHGCAHADRDCAL